MSNEENIEQMETIEQDQTIVEEPKFNPKKSLQIPKGIVKNINDVLNGVSTLDPIEVEYKTSKEDLKFFNENKAYSLKNYEQSLNDYMNDGDIKNDNKHLKRFLINNFRQLLDRVDKDKRIFLLSSEGAGSVVSGILFAVLTKIAPDQYGTYDLIKESLPEGSIGPKSEIKMIETMNKVLNIL